MLIPDFDGDVVSDDSPYIPSIGISMYCTHSDDVKCTSDNYRRQNLIKFEPYYRVIIVNFTRIVNGSYDHVMIFHLLDY